MRITILSPTPRPIWRIVRFAAMDRITCTDEKLPDDHNADWLISYNYRHLIREPLLSRFKGRAINLHTSLLPWNRGASPNFWSFFDETPKGVTIHQIDRGIDTGDIIAQKEVKFPGYLSLRQTYDTLQSELVSLFAAHWRDLRKERIAATPQTGPWTYHGSTETKMWTDKLPNGWDTDIGIPTVWGAQHRRAATGEDDAALGGPFFDKIDGEMREAKAKS